VAEAELAAGVTPAVGAIGDAVVGHHRFRLHPLRAVPGHRPPEEGDGVIGTLRRQHFGIGEAAVVVDRHVKVLPPRPRTMAHSVLQNALPHRPEAAQLLDVDVQQLARTLTLVADHCGTRGAGTS